MIGKDLSHYRILEKLGSGGMGEVYVAEDTKLHRNVALKILPPEMATEERRHRFEREAQAIAALNHPNIVTIHSVEETEGVHFITMELVKGKTLTELIPKKGLALNKFLEIAIPLADAVSTAHEQGITHRDLKPDNLMVNEEGRLKILDFGLAKLKQELAQEGASELPTKSATQEGRILGTVAYMSPEQAEGKSIDHRSDIFSMGIILYEMATGERPFKGDTTVSILSSIMKDTPTSVTEINPDRPHILAKIIKRCLAKDPTRRYQSALDLRNELEELKQDVESGEVFERAAQPSRPVKWMVGIAVAIVATAAVTYLLMRGGQDTSESQAAPIEGTLTQLTSQPGPEWFPSLSPDGDNVVYTNMQTGNWDIYLKRVGGERIFNLTENSPADDTQPAFSPDGELIAFRSERDGGGIFLMGATGESVRRLTDFGYNPAWSPDGKEIACAIDEGVRGGYGRFSSSQLWAVNIATAEKRLVTNRDSVQPSWSPSGVRIAYWASTETGGQRDIWTIPAIGGDAIPVTNDAYIDWSPVWSPDGKHIYFASNRGGSMNLWRVRIDEETGEVLGQPESVTTGASSSHRHLSFAKDGKHLAYVEYVLSSNIWKAGFDSTTGTVEGESVPVIPGSRQTIGPDVSPDGAWLAFHSGGNQHDIFVTRTDGKGRRQLTNDLYYDRFPRWSPDGERIAFYSNRGGSTDIWTIRPDGSELRQITETPDHRLTHPAWSPDGLRMSCWDYEGQNSYIFDPNKAWEEQTPEALPPINEDGEQYHALLWSPDGCWLVGVTEPNYRIVAYSLELRQYRELPGMAPLGAPSWLPDSRRLLVSGEEALHIADIESGSVGEIMSLSPDQVRVATVSPDGKTLYFTRSSYEADIWMLTLN